MSEMDELTTAYVALEDIKRRFLVELTDAQRSVANAMKMLSDPDYERRASEIVRRLDTVTPEGRALLAWAHHRVPKAGSVVPELGTLCHDFAPGPCDATCSEALDDVESGS